MKITALETFAIEPRWLFLAIRTDEGITGWGEPIVEGKAATVAAAVEEMSDYLIGKDPFRIEDHWQVLYRGGFYRGGPVLSSALSGIDQALWDIKGKAFGVPIYELLGGAVRDKMRVYAWIHADDPEGAADQARERVEQGFDAIKMNLGNKMHHYESKAVLDAEIRRVAVVREAVGDGVDIGLDFHGRYTPALAREACRRLEDLHPFFVEEPVVPELSGDLAKICDATTIPIATGERLYSRWDYREVLRTGIAIVQPDLSHAGGISECRRIASMAEAYGVALAPHCPLGPIALAACFQIDFASPNALIQENALDIHYNEGSPGLSYLLDPSVFGFQHGYAELPTGPGLGIEVDEAAVRKASETGHRWRNVLWRHEDGSLAEW